jgi:hypothetical protein
MGMKLSETFPMVAADESSRARYDLLTMGCAARVRMPGSAAMERAAGEERRGEERRAALATWVLDWWRAGRSGRVTNPHQACGSLGFMYSG